MVEFGTEFEENRQPRCPCVLLLDTSGSMSGRRIAALNAGLVTFADELRADPLATKRVEVAVMNFPPVKLATFQSAHEFIAPRFTADGPTPMGEAMTAALGLIERRKVDYRTHGIEYFRPWIFLVTDGEPTDKNWEHAAAAAREAMREKHTVIWTVGVEDADMTKLAEFSTKPPLALQGLKFQLMFQWLTRSLAAVAGSNSHSGANPKENVSFENPGSWGQLDD
jgi:uncharacterized protein YegL